MKTIKEKLGTNYYKSNVNKRLFDSFIDKQGTINTARGLFNLSGEKSIDLIEFIQGRVGSEGDIIYWDAVQYQIEKIIELLNNNFEIKEINENNNQKLTV